MDTDSSRKDTAHDYDCLPCRLTGGAGLAAAAVYVFPGRRYVPASTAAVNAGETLHWFRFRQVFAGSLLIGGILRLAGSDNLNKVRNMVKKVME